MEKKNSLALEKIQVLKQKIEKNQEIINSQLEKVGFI